MLILGFTKERGSIKAIIVAEVAACLMKDLAAEPCRPKGGFPKKIRGCVVDGDVHLRKSAFSILGSFGSISRLIGCILDGSAFKKAPLPADGSIH